MAEKKYFREPIYYWTDRCDKAEAEVERLRKKNKSLRDMVCKAIDEKADAKAENERLRNGLEKIITDCRDESNDWTSDLSNGFAQYILAIATKSLESESDGLHNYSLQ